MIVALLAAGGCDFIYGVTRRAKISAPPNFGCVEKVIREAPGVEEVQYRRTEGERPLTWTGIKPPSDVHTFVYRDGNVLGALQVRIRYDGEIDFSQHLVDINRKPPQEQIDASRPVMRWIEETLENQCGMDGLAAAIDEHCSGVQCPALQP